MQTLKITYQLKEIDTIAYRILKHLNAKIICFNGEMGTGKTTLINALIKAMHSTDVATSPTFSIVNEYILHNDKAYHFDFYRLETEDEAYDIGIEYYLESKHWLFIEWPERIANLIPEQHNTITISNTETEERELILNIL